MGEIESIFGGTPEIKILDFLVGWPQYDYSIPELAQHTGLSRPTVAEAIERMEKNFLVEPTRKVGKAQLYKLAKNRIVRAARAMCVAHTDLEFEAEEKVRHLLHVAESNIAVHA